MQPACSVHRRMSRQPSRKWGGYRVIHFHQISPFSTFVGSQFEKNLFGLTCRIAVPVLYPMEFNGIFHMWTFPWRLHGNSMEYSACNPMEFLQRIFTCEIFHGIPLGTETAIPQDRHFSRYSQHRNVATSFDQWHFTTPKASAPH